jgi:hypothetical protein
VWVAAAATFGVLLLRSAPWGFFALLLLRLLLGLGGEICFLFFFVPVFFELRSICFLYFEICFLYLEICSSTLRSTSSTLRSASSPDQQPQVHLYC